jgi:hypothetical protein
MYVQSKKKNCFIAEHSADILEIERERNKNPYKCEQRKS